MNQQKPIRRQRVSNDYQSGSNVLYDNSVNTPQVINNNDDLVSSNINVSEMG